jgi:hypothetical protein
VDAKVLSPDLAGIIMPSPDSQAEDVNLPNLSLLYDEVCLLWSELADVDSLLFMMFLKSRFDTFSVSK